MTDHRSPPPEPEACLTFPRASRYKGGTLIREDVHDLNTHKKLLADPDGYRPPDCARCGGLVLHVHDHLTRFPLGEPGLPGVIGIIRYICANLACKATWRILPAFLARHLWRVWVTVERTTHPATTPVPKRAREVPRRTASRWRARLASAAKQLVVLLATSSGALLEEIAQSVGLESTRWVLVDVHTQEMATPPQRRLADLASLVDRLERGIRLM
jgi:hypothetical protein